MSSIPFSTATTTTIAPVSNSTSTPHQHAYLQALIELGRKEPSGFDQAMALSYIPGIAIHDLANAINTLSRDGQLLVFTTQQGKYRWKLESDERYTKLQGLGQTDRIVYEAIERSSNQGIWIKDLRKRTNITGNHDLEKSLKILLSRKLIKSEESVAGKNKKVFMLYELTPAVEVTGGVWYTAKTKDVDLPFVKDMKKAITIVLGKTGPATAEFLANYLREKKAAKIELTSNDIKTLCTTMVYDGTLCYATHDEIADQQLKTKYSSQYILTHQTHNNNNSTDIDFDESEDPEPIFAIPCVDDIETIGIDLSVFASPCVGCQLFDKCGSGNVIEPESCQYYTQWISDKGEYEVKEWVAALEEQNQRM
jgi:DNA-directed RNA polymerase III subunit RPC6